VILATEAVLDTAVNSTSMELADAPKFRAIIAVRAGMPDIKLRFIVAEKDIDPATPATCG